MRKWTMSACLVAASCVLPLVAAAESVAGGTVVVTEGIMPRWLKLILLLAGLLTLTSFLIEPVAVLARRRRAAHAAAQPAHADEPLHERLSLSRPRIIQADHDRLIVTYSAHDDTVYLLTPPGEDPRTVLRAARVVVPEAAYVELADHLRCPRHGHTSDLLAGRPLDQAASRISPADQPGIHEAS